MHVDPQPFAGPYRSPADHFVIEVTAIEGELDALQTRFKPAGVNRFAAVTGPEITFEPGDGRRMRMTLNSPDTAPQIFERFQPIKPTAEDLAQYAGEYRSEALQATYKFAREDGKLTLARNWQQPAVLQPSVRDEFQGPGHIGIVFRRDAAGRITQCEIFAGRVRNIVFARK